MPNASRDYFSFETIRDKEKSVVCYYVTAIGTIEANGLVRMRDDLGEEKDRKMAFGRITIQNNDRKIKLLLHETGTRDYYHTHDDELGSEDVISFTARDWRADEAYEFREGDRVLVEGRAYVRANNDEKYPGRLPEVSITAPGLFLLGHARVNRKKSINSSLVPQEGIERK